ncbi:MAG: HEAT repeat domain-containing protein [Planctomycetota bacterium]|nr:HEAT repeat domain-containing protein [Planctomycetota bacterium]
MPTRQLSQSVLIAAAALAGPAALLPAPAAMAQFGEQDPANMSNEQLLEDFIYYVYINQVELAEAHANALLQRGMTPQQFVGMIEDSAKLRRRFDEGIRQAMFKPGLEDVAAQLTQLFEEGKRARARDPEEISRNIRLLTENPRARMLARERLMFASEYALPQLLQVLLERQNPALEGHVEQLLVEMGGDAVMPLCAAVTEVDEATQERIARILGQIQYSSALPYLYDVARSSSSQGVRQATTRAIALIQRADMNTNVSVAEQYWRLGEQYYDESLSLTRFPREDHQLLWTFNQGIGLYATPVRTEVFHEARAMELAERAMEDDQNHEGAASLWLAANFSREIDAPEGYTNPAYDRPRGALYYAVAAGSEPTQRVLARALEDQDTPLARRVIEALTLGAGGKGLWEGLGAERPLLDALSYPDRRVQYEAALAIGRAAPRESFEGSDRVTPILASAVRDASARYAIALADTPQRQQELFAALEDAGYEVLQSGGSLSDVQAAIAETAGVDMIVLDLPRSRAEETLNAIRGNAKLRVTPVLALLDQLAWNDLWPRFEFEELTDIRREGIDSRQMVAAIEQLSERATGPAVTEGEAEQYASRALDVLRDLAISRNPVFLVGDAAPALITAMEEASREIRSQIADVLARVDMKRAQVALMDAALDYDAEERVEMLEKVAESAKLFGNMLDDRQVRDLLALAEAADSDLEATAAAALIGVLNLPQASTTSLILGHAADESSYRENGPAVAERR